MLASPFALLIPLVLAFVLSVGIRMGAGVERAARFGGLALPVAFLIGWALIVKPGWFAYDALGRIGHIVLGAALVGLVCDAWLKGRVFLTVGALCVLVVSAWAEVNGGVSPLRAPSLPMAAAFAAAVGIGGIALWRFDRLRTAEHAHMPPGGVWLIVSVMTTLSLLAVAAAAGDQPLRLTAAVLTAALVGCGIWSWLSRQDVVGAAVALSAAMAQMAIAWALFERSPFAGVGLVLTGLILFADGTASRVPLPKAGISRFLAPLVLAGIAVIPLALGAIVTLVMLPATK